MINRIDIELPGSAALPRRIKLSATRSGLTMFWVYAHGTERYVGFGQADSCKVSHYKDTGTGVNYLQLGEVTFILDPLEGALIDCFLYTSFPPEKGVVA